MKLPGLTTRRIDKGGHGNTVLPFPDDPRGVEEPSQKQHREANHNASKVEAIVPQVRYTNRDIE